MKPYRDSTSLTAMRAEWTVEFDDEPERTERGVVLLSTTQARRALWRLIAHLEKQFPGARRYEAHFPALDIYCGEEP